MYHYRISLWYFGGSVGNDSPGHSPRWTPLGEKWCWPPTSYLAMARAGYSCDISNIVR